MLHRSEEIQVTRRHLAERHVVAERLLVPVDEVTFSASSSAHIEGPLKRALKTPSRATLSTIDPAFFGAQFLSEFRPAQDGF
jgi:hypothetical protein